MSLVIKARPDTRPDVGRLGVDITYRLSDTCPERTLHLTLGQARQLYLELDFAVEASIKGKPR